MIAHERTSLKSALLVMLSAAQFAARSIFTNCSRPKVAAEEVVKTLRLRRELRGARSG